MTEIIKPFERFDWQKKINSLSPQDARKFQFQEYRRASEDKEYWFKQYVWTIDARKQPSIVPFILYGYQINLIKQLERFLDTFIDKSRQMGISWTIMGFELHNVLYKRGFNCLNISRKESEVEDAGKTHNSLHGRLHFMYGRLPPYLKPKIHAPNMTFQVPSMNAVIKGESSNPKAGRDSQYSFIFIDEAAHIECLDEMWKGCRSASNSICVNSTPPKSKVNNKFAELKEMKNSGFTHMSFHWREHPEYNDDWYAKKTASMTPQEIAQELEIAYDAALTDTSYPEYKDDIHLLGHKVYLNPNVQLMCFMDFGLSGEVFLFAQKDGYDRLFFIKYHIFYNKLTHELYALFLHCLAGIGYIGKIEDMLFIGDKSGNKRQRTSKTSVIQEYYTVSQGKVRIMSKEISNEDKMKDMKYCLKNNCSNGKPQFNISKEESCLKFAEAMRCMQLNKQGNDHLDNKFTHVVNAAEYGVSYLFPRKKDDPFCVCSDPGDKLVTEDGGVQTIGSPRTMVASATAVIGNYRIQKRGVIIR